MKEAVILESDAMTEAQAKVEVARMQVKMRDLRTQINRDRDECRRIDARIEAKMADVRAALTQLQAMR